MAKKELKNRFNLANYIEVQIENSWGSLRYRGPWLSTFDEDVLHAILARIHEINNGAPSQPDEDDIAIKYEDTIYQIIKKMRLTNCSENYSRVRQSIQLMHEATVIGEDKNTEDIELNGIIVLGRLKPQRGEKVILYLSRVFYDTMVSGRVTPLDIERRRALNATVGKAIYRFVTSHKSKKWTGGLKTLALAINLRRQPLYKWRETINSSIDEMKRKSILTEYSHITSSDTVILNILEE